MFQGTTRVLSTLWQMKTSCATARAAWQLLFSKRWYTFILYKMPVLYENIVSTSLQPYKMEPENPFVRNSSSAILWPKLLGDGKSEN